MMSPWFTAFLQYVLPSLVALTVGIIAWPRITGEAKKEEATARDIAVKTDAFLREQLQKHDEELSKTRDELAETRAELQEQRDHRVMERDRYEKELLKLQGQVSTQELKIALQAARIDRLEAEFTRMGIDPATINGS